MKGMKLWNVTDLDKNPLRAHYKFALKACNSQQMKAKLSFGNVAKETLQI